MLFTVTPPPSDGAAAATAATVDEFTTTGNTLTQLQNFFEHHTFDTAGPYSDLFSVLLSCCKHLVDTNLHHHAVLSNQKHEVGRLSSETEALCDVAARCQEGIRELKSSSLDPRLVERRIQSPSPPVSAVTETAAAAAAAHNADIELLRGRLDEVYGHVRESQASVRETRLRQADLERQSADERRRQQQAEEQFRHLEEDVAKLKRGVSAHADYVDGEVAAMRNTAASSSTDRGPALKSYTDKKIKALRNELCIALQEAVLAEDVVGPSAPAARSPRRSARAAAPTAARRVAERGGGDDNDNDDDD
ncbi:hypothetical protein DQ04_05111030, partial [Trypanosoma grayi]|uniref:hypothetical protein n=1 Tax=Trypanosoma grayi TaxID=71804 RepID=UPI0004F4B228